MMRKFDFNWFCFDVFGLLRKLRMINLCTNASIDYYVFPTKNSFYFIAIKCLLWIFSLQSKVLRTLIRSYQQFSEFIGVLKQIIFSFFSYLSDYLQIKLKHTPYKTVFKFLNHDLRTLNHDLRTLNHDLRTCAYKHCTLNHKHCTLNRKHSTVNHKHSTVNHKHCTLNHKHCTLNWKHSTLNWKHSTCAWKHSKIKRIYKAFTGKHLCANYVCRFIDYKQSCKNFIQF